MGSKKVKAPPPRDYKQEMMDAMSAQEAIQPRLLALERQYTPLYQQLQNENQIRGMQMMQDAYGASIPRSAQLSQQYAEAMQPALAGIGTSARNAYNATLDPSVSGLMATLGQQATADLSRGTALSPEEQKQSQQAARMAMAARGLSGNQAIAQEVLNDYNLGQARQQAARSFAASVYGMGQGAAQQAMGMYGNTMLGAAQNFSPAAMYGTTANMQQGLGAQIFQPESQYNAQLITANRKEAMDAQIANAQSRNALTSGLMSMAGSVVGGMASGGTGFFAPSAPPCWVAREVYGEENPKWLFFREWLETSSPKWFHQLYLEEGERFAEYIKDKPFLKAIIRFGMDFVIKFNYNSNQVTI